MEKNNSTSAPKKFRFTPKSIAGIVIALVILVAGIFLLWPATDTATAEPDLQTAKVRTGDLIVTASGAGTVVPMAEVALGFRTSGMLTELNVSVGDAVTAGRLLARLEENIQAEADFQALFTPEGIAQTEGEVARAQIALEDIIAYLSYVISPDVYHYEVKLAEAQLLLDNLNADAAASEADKSASRKNLERAQNNLKAAQARYVNDYVPATFTYTWIDDETGEEVTGTIPPTATDITLARANVESARVALQDAKGALEIVKAGPVALSGPIAALGAQMAGLEQARLAMESTRLAAPFDGTITSLDAVIGQTVGTSPIMSVATTQELLVRFYLDETDIGKVAAGKRVTFTFDAYPDLPMEGDVIRVEPALQIVDGTPVLVVWAALPTQTEALVLSGMTVEVDVIAGEARGALIVPVQALRELSPGSFAVFVVQSDGQLILTPVTVGLRDYANAEILSGLQAGDVVSTGNVETE